MQWAQDAQKAAQKALEEEKAVRELAGKATNALPVAMAAVADAKSASEEAHRDEGKIRQMLSELRKDSARGAARSPGHRVSALAIAREIRRAASVSTRRCQGGVGGRSGSAAHAPLLGQRRSGSAARARVMQARGGRCGVPERARLRRSRARSYRARRARSLGEAPSALGDVKAEEVHGKVLASFASS